MLLETLLVIPIALIAVLAIVELATLTSGMTFVKRASREAADVATALPLPLTGPVPPQVLDAVDASLAEHSVTWTEVRLEHNIGPAPPYVLVSGPGTNCAPPTARPNTPWVMVTVCVEQSQLAPNLLQTFCFDLNGRFVQQTTIRCY